MFILTVARGPDEGRQFPLSPGTTYTVGSGEEDTVRLTDPKVLGRHCALEVKPAYVLLKNLTATAGTFVGEKKIAQSELRGPASFRIGDTTLAIKPGVAEKPPPPTDPLVGRIIGGYKLIEVVGKGGMGTVFKATQLSLHRDVALKVLAPALAKDKNFVDLFINEARAAAQLIHPNIVQVYDAGTEGDISFFSMEYLAQGSVEEVLARDKKMAWQEAILMVLEAAHGLEYAEGKRIVHRDIKPDNLMLNADGRVKIADLGLAKRGEESKDEGVIGTPHFIPPEQALGKEVDTRADIYSLGATFFRMVTGRTLFSGKSAKEIVLKHIKEPPPAASSVEKEIPDELDLIFARMLAKEPDQRYQTARELITALETVCAHHGIKGSIIRRGVGKRVLVPLVLLLLAGGGVIYKLATREKEVVESPEAREARLKAERDAADFEKRNAALVLERRRTAVRTEWETLDNAFYRIAAQNSIDSVYDDEEKTAATLEKAWLDYFAQLREYAGKPETAEFEEELGFAAKALEKAATLAKRLENNKLAASDKKDWIARQKEAAKDIDGKSRLRLAELLRERAYERAANYCERLTKEPRPKEDPFLPVESAEWQSPVAAEVKVPASTVKQIADIIAKSRQYFADEGKLIVRKAQGDWDAVKASLPPAPETSADAEIEKAAAALQEVEEKFVDAGGRPVKEIQEFAAEARRKRLEFTKLLETRYANRLGADRELIRRKLRDLRSLDPSRTPNLIMNLEVGKALAEWQRLLEDGEVKSPRYRAFLEERIRMLRWIDYLFATFQRDVRISDATKEAAPLRSLESEGVFEEGSDPFPFRFDKPPENPYEFKLNRKFRGNDLWRYGSMPLDWVHTHCFHVPGKNGAAGEIRWVEVPPVLRFALGAFCYETMQYRAAQQHFELLKDDETYGTAAAYLLERSGREAAARAEYESLLQKGREAKTTKDVQTVLAALKTFNARHAGTLFLIEVMRQKDLVDSDFFGAEEVPAMPKTPPRPA